MLNYANVAGDSEHL